MVDTEIDDIDFDSVGVAHDRSGMRSPDSEATEVFGGRAGRPAAREPMRYFFYPTWRSQIINLVAFFVLSVLAVYLSRQFDSLIIKGPLISLGKTTYYLHLPLLVLLPGFILGKILINIYDAKYIIDERGVEAQVGLVSLQLRQPRLRFEDIRGVEPTQTLWERMLGIGHVLIGSAMTQDVEISMNGVANPRAIQLLINAERDRYVESLKGNNAFLKQAVTSD